MWPLRKDNTVNDLGLPFTPIRGDQALGWYTYVRHGIAAIMSLPAAGIGRALVRVVLGNPAYDGTCSSVSCLPSASSAGRKQFE
jgi:hypothetical protein